MYPNTRKLMGKKPLELSCPDCGKSHTVEFGLILDALAIKCPYCHSTTYYELEEETHQMLSEMEEELKMIVSFVS